VSICQRVCFFYEATDSSGLMWYKTHIGQCQSAITMLLHDPQPKHYQVPQKVAVKKRTHSTLCLIEITYSTQHVLTQMENIYSNSSKKSMLSNFLCLLLIQSVNNTFLYPKLRCTVSTRGYFRLEFTFPLLVFWCYALALVKRHHGHVWSTSLSTAFSAIYLSNIFNLGPHQRISSSFHCDMLFFSEL